MRLKVTSVLAFLFILFFYLATAQAHSAFRLATDTLDPAARLAPAQDGPTLQLSAHVTTTHGAVITVPLTYHANGFAIGVTSFSIDIDQTCLRFDPADRNQDGRPDAITFFVPAGMNAAVAVDLTDAAGELDFIIADYFPPFVSLPARTPLLELQLTAVCQPEPGTNRIAPLLFGSEPVPSFGSTAGASIPGNAINGAVRVFGPAVVATPTATPTLVATGPATTITATPTPTLVPTVPAFTVLEEFTATPRDETIWLTWRTSNGMAASGFYLYRKRVDQRYLDVDFRLITPLLPSQSAEAGVYRLVDADVQADARYLYLLVEETVWGTRIEHIELMITGSLKALQPYRVWLPLIVD